jgi:hypothetical protein
VISVVKISESLNHRGTQSFTKEKAQRKKAWQGHVSSILRKLVDGPFVFSAPGYDHTADVPMGWSTGVAKQDHWELISRGVNALAASNFVRRVRSRREKPLKLIW